MKEGGVDYNISVSSHETAQDLVVLVGKKATLYSNKTQFIMVRKALDDKISY